LIISENCSTRKKESDESPSSKIIEAEIKKNRVVYIDTVIEDQAIKIYLNNDSLFFELNSELASVTSFGKPDFYPVKNTKGLYRLDKGTLVKSSISKRGDRLYFAIPDEQNRGQLYVLDVNSKKIYVDKKFRRNYLISYSGIFLLNEKNNTIIGVDKPVAKEGSEKLNTNLFFYSLRDSLQFEFQGEKSMDGGYYFDDSLILNFMRNNMK
jgi:hypothetical protein